MFLPDFETHNDPKNNYRQQKKNLFLFLFCFLEMMIHVDEIYRNIRNCCLLMLDYNANLKFRAFVVVC